MAISKTNIDILISYLFLVPEFLFQYSHLGLQLTDCFTVFMSLGVQ